MSVCDQDNWLSLEAALTHILSNANLSQETLELPLAQANHHILRQDCYAAIDLPPFSASAMDGYALHSTSIQTPPYSMPVRGRHIAGDVPGSLIPATAARIFTGAPLPTGADTVIPQEDCTCHDDNITINTRITPGQFVRPRGSHLAQGGLIARSGTRLTPALLGMLATTGLPRIRVSSPLRVVLISTGNELAEPGSHLQPGQIYNANHILLASLLSGLGCHVIRTHTVADDPAAIRRILHNAQDCDLILTSGGASVGDEDHMVPLARELGTLRFWRIAIKPGKPLAHGTIGTTPLFILPGNPVSCLLTFLLCVRPYVLTCLGAAEIHPRTLPVTTTFDRHRAEPRREFLRVKVQNESNTLRAHLHPQQDSGTLISCCQSDGLLCIPENMTFTSGTTLEFIPFTELWC